MIGNGCQQHKLECEARHWIRWVRAQYAKHGRDTGLAIWEAKKHKLRKIRGEDSVNNLVALMNEQRASV